jgi:hypothetical protein
MNPDLMCTAGLKAAFDECEFTEVFDNAHVGDRTLPWTALQGGPATAVASVTIQVRLDALRLRLPADHG